MSLECDKIQYLHNGMIVIEMLKDFVLRLNYKQPTICIIVHNRKRKLLNEIEYGIMVNFNVGLTI